MTNQENQDYPAPSGIDSRINDNPTLNIPTYSQINTDGNQGYNAMGTDIYGGLNNNTDYFNPGQDVNVNQIDGEKPKNLVIPSDNSNIPLQIQGGNYGYPDNINMLNPQQPMPQPQPVIVNPQPQQVIVQPVPPQPIIVQPIQPQPVIVENIEYERYRKPSRGSCYCYPPKYSMCNCCVDTNEEYHCCIVVLLYILCILGYICLFLCLIVTCCPGGGHHGGHHGGPHGPHGGGPHGHGHF